MGISGQSMNGYVPGGVYWISNSGGTRGKNIDGGNAKNIPFFHYRTLSSVDRGYLCRLWFL